MKLLDANILLYAPDADSAPHAVCRDWLTRVLNEPEPVGLPWQALLAFVRIATNPRAVKTPLSIVQACAIEQGATLCSTNRDFLRFPRLKRLDPMQTA